VSPTEAAPAADFIGWLPAIGMENLPLPARENVAVPLPPSGGQGGGRLKPGSSEAADEDRHEGGCPGGASAKRGRRERLFGQEHERTPPHSKARMWARVSAHHEETCPHLESRRLAAAPSDRQNTPPHPGAREFSGVAPDHDQATLEAGLASRKRRSDVVASPAGHPNPPPGHLAGQPVAGVALDLESPASHALGGVPADVAPHHDPARIHRRRHGVHPREVTPAFEHAVRRGALDAKHSAELAGPFVGSNRQSPHIVGRQGGEPRGCDSREVDGERAASGGIGRGSKDERHGKTRESRWGHVTKGPNDSVLQPVWPRLGG
jgi:hypothetical protein